MSAINVSPDRSETVYETQAAMISVGARDDGLASRITRVPKRIFVRDELPLLPVGKVAKASAGSDNNRDR